MATGRIGQRGHGKSGCCGRRKAPARRRRARRTAVKTGCKCSF
ncbi:hypothetical protein C7S16_4136 [Burkholderia thailandensis]|nr:hypothetical protein [Burkholderia thailandensis]MDW9255900.1 hypothetical protein [Burkholderia thailandensis]